MKKTEQEAVVFRKDKDGVFAMFPYLPWNKRGTAITAYAHVGQHFGLYYKYSIQDSRPAKPEEYKELLTELKGIGYNLRVIKRASYKSMEHARRAHRELLNQIES